MSNIFLALGPVPEPPEPDPWAGVSMSWTGTDGSSWSLECSKGVYLLAGVEGLTREEAPTLYTSQSANVHGETFRGLNFGPRPVFWPVKVYAPENSQAWLELDKKFAASLNPRGTGVWRVTQPDGTWRELTCRPLRDGAGGWRDMPGARSWKHYAIEMVAEDPFWYGPPIESPLWKQADPIDYIPEEGAPPLHPGSIQTFGSAVMSNPGDEPASPLWTVQALPGGSGVSSVSLSVGGVSTGFGAIPAGQTLTIDTDPRVQQAMLNGVDVTGSLTSWDFPQILPGADVPIGITMTGEGTVQASIRGPRFDRAW
ncbi:hypothetical protein [Occultella kanbiaonis]|uniref:hypothetical protein n=1 Tax=Occultella kanbiaonis TaxID=2675754 RepID=UPI0013D1EFAF|nr:hypothetical protein [Occultella kanbiaonis]